VHLTPLQVQYLHPKDGVYPEKVNQGRNAVNANKGRIGENLNPVQIKFSGKLVSMQRHMLRLHEHAQRFALGKLAPHGLAC
jgi:PsaD